MIFNSQLQKSFLKANKLFRLGFFPIFNISASGEKVFFLLEERKTKNCLENVFLLFLSFRKRRESLFLFFHP